MSNNGKWIRDTLDDKFVEFYTKGLNDSQIGRELEINHVSARNIRLRLGLPKIFKYSSKVDKGKLIELHSEGLNDREIAKHFGINSRWIGEIRLNLGLDRNLPSNNGPKPTNRQRQILIGGLLGDSYMGKERNCEYGFTHSLKQEQYCRWKAEELSSLNSKVTLRTENDKRSNTIYYSCAVRLSVNFHLNEFYEEFYKNSRTKRVSEKYLDELNSLGLAIWFMDDGYYHKGSGGFGLCTQSFYNVERLLIKSKMKNKFDLNMTIWKDGGMYIPKKDADKFRNLIKEYIHPEVSYKLGL